MSSAIMTGLTAHETIAYCASVTLCIRVFPAAFSNHKPLFLPAVLKPAGPESSFLSQRQSSSIFGRIHQLNGHEFEQTLGDSGSQGRLV